MSMMCIGSSAWLVKQLPQPRPSSVLPMVAGMVVVVTGVLPVWLRDRVRTSLDGHLHRCPYRTLDNFVEFAPIEPHAAALRTIVNFHTLSFRHDKVRIWADWAFHVFCSLFQTSCCSVVFVISPWRRNGLDFTDSR